jgi:hypothetical protein
MRRTTAEMDLLRGYVEYALIKYGPTSSYKMIIQLQRVKIEFDGSFPEFLENLPYPRVQLSAKDLSVNVSINRKTITRIYKEPQIQHLISVLRELKETRLDYEQMQRKMLVAHKKRLHVRHIDPKDRPYDKSEEELQKEKRKDEIARASLLTKTNFNLNYLLNNYYLNKGVNSRTGKIEVTNDYKGRKSISIDPHKADPRRTRVNANGKSVNYIPDALKGIRLSTKYIKESFDYPRNSNRNLWVFDNLSNYKNKTGKHEYFWYTEDVKEFLKGQGDVIEIPITYNNEQKFQLRKEWKRKHRANGHIPIPKNSTDEQRLKIQKEINRINLCKQRLNKFQLKEMRELMWYASKY